MAALPPLCVDGVDLLQADLDQAQTAVAATALGNRLDVMNSRAATRGLLAADRRSSKFLARSAQRAIQSRQHHPAGQGPTVFVLGPADEPPGDGERGTPARPPPGAPTITAPRLIAYQRGDGVLQATEDYVKNDVRAELAAVRRPRRKLPASSSGPWSWRTSRWRTPWRRSRRRLPSSGGGVGTGGGGGSNAGNAAALTQQLLSPRNLPAAQNALYQVWVNYLVGRLQLYRDLE